MTDLYALLVGIDEYRDPAYRLSGCRNDVTAARKFLESRRVPAGQLLIEELCDSAATRAAIVDGFGGHLGRAGAGDTALFWFSGHGSYAPVPPELSYDEPSGQLQTLVCVDSRHGGTPDLLDKELWLLIGDVATNGVHVVVVLDCCHSGGGTREAGLRTRSMPGLSASPPIDDLLPKLRERAAAEAAGGRWAGAEAAGDGAGGHWAGGRWAGADHVALAACRSAENARELLCGGEQRGVFSYELLAALQRLGSTATYRQLLTAARCEVENAVHHQVPQLHPVEGNLADQPFLGGHILAPQTAISMRFGREGWEIDIGSCHGLVSPPDDPVRVALHGSEPIREAYVTQVLTERSLVKPVRWHPEPDRPYPVVLSGVPLPATTVAIGGSDGIGGLDLALRRVAAALRTAGPGGRPSPHVRQLEPRDGDAAPELRVVAPRPGVLRMMTADGEPLAADVSDVDGQGARRVVSDLEHVARWRQIKKLANPLSGLANAVTIEVVAVWPGDTIAPTDRPALRAEADGTILLRYRRTPTAWAPPTVFVRLHNNSSRALYCVLLNLTDRFRIHQELFSGYVIGAKTVAAALRGQPVAFTLPPGREPQPGVFARDWLKLLVAEEEFNSAAFALHRLGEPEPSPASRSPIALKGLLDRLGWAALNRGDARGDAPAAHDWTTAIVPILTHVPGPG